MNASGSAVDVLSSMDALADQTRSRLLLLLEERELTVSELQAVLQQPQSTVSRHLKILHSAGWVASRVEGTSRWYSMVEKGLNPSAGALWRAIRDEIAARPAAMQDRQRATSVVAQRRTNSKAFFSSAAGRWDTLRQDMFGDRTQITALLALLDPNWVVGDLGCGTGQIAASVAPFVHRVVAVDDSGAMMEAAQARLADLPNVELRPGELENLPIADGELDAALIFLVLHHIVEPERVITRARRALRPGGHMLIVDMMPHDRDRYRKDMGHVWQGFSEEHITAWFAGAGLLTSRYLPLPADAGASGPTLFAATARNPLSAASAAAASDGDGNLVSNPLPAGQSSS